MSSDQWDPAQVVRIRMVLADGREQWSRRLSRLDAELHVAAGSTWLAIIHGRGSEVRSAAIVVWTFN